MFAAALRAVVLYIHSKLISTKCSRKFAEGAQSTRKGREFKATMVRKVQVELTRDLQHLAPPVQLNIFKHAT
jgi:hypothetical protein